MKRLAALLIILSGLAAIAPCQTLKEYVALRKKHGITQAVGVEALESFVGRRVMEIRGIVKGSFGMNGRTTYLVEQPDGGHIEVASAGSADWLAGGTEVAARLLVVATRETETSPLGASLIGAAPEHEIARLEKLAQPKAAPVKPKSPPPPLRGPIGNSRGTAATSWNLSADQALPYYAGYIKRYNKRLAEEQAVEIARGILGYSIRYGVDARLIMAMVLVESGFNPNSRSYAGAMGLGQLMPGTAAGMGVTNAYDTMQNLYATTRLVRGKIDKYSKRTGDPFQTLILTLADYNAGSGAVRRHGYTVPPYKQTQNYIQKVVATYRKFLGY